MLVIRAQSAYLEKVKYVMTTEDKLIDYVKNKFTYLKSINENYKNNIRLVLRKYISVTIPQYEYFAVILKTAATLTMMNKKTT